MENNKPKTGEKGKRYQGYDVNKVMVQNSRQKKPWFWKVLGISLLLTLLIIGITAGIAMRRRKQQTNYLSKINESNSVDILLDGHSNITVSKTYKGLKDMDDYTTTRFLKKSEKGTLFSYLKTEGLEEDYKEVLSGEKLYRYDGNYTYYYGLVGDDYDHLREDIESEILQLEGSESVEEQTESTDIMRVTLNYEVQAGDPYTKLYGFETGTTIKKVLTIDIENLIVTSDAESVNDEEIYVYTVTFDGENKNPKFFRSLKGAQDTRVCTVYYDFGGGDEKKYEFKVPVDVYFDLLSHDDYTTYMEEECLIEFSKSQMQLQNPQTDLTLYMKKGE